jgi:hypothetical protein
VNTESTQRQYALVHRAVELGWPADRVIIDEDQGPSVAGPVGCGIRGASAAVRQALGFERLFPDRPVAEAHLVALGPRPRRDDTVHHTVHDVDGGPVVQGDARRHGPVQEELVVGRPALAVSVVVWATGPL